MVTLSSATSAISFGAVASSPLRLASPTSFDAAFLRARAVSWTRMIARLRSSIDIRLSDEKRFLSTSASPRRARPRSKASGFSRMKRMSCMALSKRHARLQARAPETTSYHVGRDADGRNTSGHDESKKCVSSIIAPITPPAWTLPQPPGRRAPPPHVSRRTAPTRPSPRRGRSRATPATSGSTRRAG